MKYDCHINVEICFSISAVKYLYECVYEGHDMAMFRLERVDENNNGVPLPFTNEIVQYSCDKQRYYLDLAKSRGRIGSIASQQCLYQLSILCK